MTKDAFFMILERQRNSGLTIREFCMNEGYYPATFYYWKSKFCSSHSPIPVSAGSCVKDISEDFAPVRIAASRRLSAPPAAEGSPKGLNEIMIELPTGIKIHFRGINETKAAMRLIGQIYTGHVLPQ
jgi:putative transposase